MENFLKPGSDWDAAEIALFLNRDIHSIRVGSMGYE